MRLSGISRSKRRVCLARIVQSRKQLTGPSRHDFIRDCACIRILGFYLLSAAELSFTGWSTRLCASSSVKPRVMKSRIPLSRYSAPQESTFRALLVSQTNPVTAPGDGQIPPPAGVEYEASGYRLNLLLQFELDQSPTVPLSVGQRLPSHANSRSSLPPSIRTFSLFPAAWKWAGLNLSSTGTRSVSLPDLFRAALHRNSFGAAIGFYEQIGIAFQHLSHHRMLLP